MAAEIDWGQNAWFVKNAHDLLTEEFKEWWIETEGEPPDPREESKKVCGEYWRKCGYCLVGWHAHQMESGDDCEVQPLNFE